MNYVTRQYRIKDSSCRNKLSKMASSVNYVWNYCNEVNQESWRKFNRFYTGFDLNNKTKGCSEELGISAQTVQAVCKEYATKSWKYKKAKLKWRSYKRSLGWIPFSGQQIKVQHDTIKYLGNYFKVWLSRPIEGIIKTGSFTQDSRGRWYANLVIETSDFGRIPTGNKVGIDLGVSNIATLSNGAKISRNSYTNLYAKKLALAQRANKRRLVTSIHAKIKNKRKDWNHKTTHQLIHDYDYIAIGNVKASEFMQTRLSKGISDASWYTFKTILVYKAKRFGVEFREVDESFSTVTCSICGKRTGPDGLSQLGVREWICSSCGTSHHRDVNAAINILLSAQGIERRRESV